MQSNTMQHNKSCKSMKVFFFFNLMFKVGLMQDGGSFYPDMF